MGFIRVVLGLVVFAIAVRLAAMLLFMIGFALKLLWIAIVLGFFVLIAWVIYKVIWPRSTQQA